MKKISPLLNQILFEVYANLLRRKSKGLFFRPFWNRPTFDLKSYLQAQGFVVIAEVKRASPLKGELRENFNPVELALSYERGGAKAISVITEEVFFNGSLEYLAAIRTVVSLPILRKDFIIDPVQIEEAKAFGADFVLLIAGILKKEELSELISYAKRLGLSSLVEVHDEEDLETALSSGAEVIGINNRNLSTLKVDPEHCFRLKSLIPSRIPVIAESGIDNQEQIRRLKAEGFSGALIGTALVRHKNPEEFLQTLLA
jgi:indole-3-glycerol phosphate synthase